MPVSLLKKFGRYTTKHTDIDIPAEVLLNELENKAQAFALKGLRMTLFADDFFEGQRGNLYASTILPGSITPYHNHDFYEFNYVTAGECAQYIDGQKMIMKAGDLLLLPPEVCHTSCPVGNGSAMNLLMRADFFRSEEEHFRKLYEKNFLTFLKKQKVYMLFHGVSGNRAAEALIHLIEEILANAKVYSPFKDSYLEKLASIFLISLTDCPHYDTVFRTDIHSTGEADIEVILQYVNDNISNVTLASLSQHFGYSGAYLSRIIKKHTGNTFVSYLTSQRLLKAEYLLTKSAIPVGKIPKLVGIDSEEYFYRMFRHFNNMTPLQFRKTRSEKKK